MGRESCLPYSCPDVWSKPCFFQALVLPLPPRPPSSPIQALALDPHDCSVLLQRALLFEGMEKYKAGADDLRTLTRLDPSNRSAAAILSRLNKAAAAMG